MKKLRVGMRVRIVYYGCADAPIVGKRGVVVESRDNHSRSFGLAPYAANVYVGRPWGALDGTALCYRHEVEVIPQRKRRRVETGNLAKQKKKRKGVIAKPR